MTPKQVRALPLLVAGVSGAETAKIVGVKASTISEWLNHRPEFIKELERLREQSIRHAIEQLHSSLSVAVGELQNIMAESKNDAIRLKAALFVIENFGIQKSASDAGLDSGSKAEISIVLHILNQLGINHAPQ